MSRDVVRLVINRVVWELRFGADSGEGRSTGMCCWASIAGGQERGVGNPAVGLLQRSSIWRPALSSSVIDGDDLIRWPGHGRHQIFSDVPTLMRWSDLDRTAGIDPTLLDSGFVHRLSIKACMERNRNTRTDQAP